MHTPPGRITNLGLLGALLLAFATGTGVVAAGSPQGRWVALAHGVAGVAVVLLIPWKTRIVRRGLQRARRSRWASLLLAALAAITLLTGLGYATGLLRSAGGTRGMWLHVAAALCLAPLAVWHVLARPARPRRTDLTRRTLLRAGALTAVAAGVYLATASVVRVAGLPGAGRRFTGSYDTGSFDPASMPHTVWLDDRTPRIDPDAWRLVVADVDGERQLSLGELAAFDVRVRAVLDCTGGWYAEQDWRARPCRRCCATWVRRAACWSARPPATGSGSPCATSIGSCWPPASAGSRWPHGTGSRPDWSPPAGGDSGG
jgi:hypothetical protein